MALTSEGSGRDLSCVGGNLNQQQTTRNVPLSLSTIPRSMVWRDVMVAEGLGQLRADPLLSAQNVSRSTRVQLLLPLV